MDEFLDQQNPSELVSIINPSAHDFTHTIVDRNGLPKKYIIKSRESLTLERYAADRLSRRLMEKILSIHKGVITQSIQQETLREIRRYE